MGREIRRVKADWQHPKEPCRYSCSWPADRRGSAITPCNGEHYVPMHEHFTYNAEEIAEGLRDGWLTGEAPYYGVPVMPQWSDEDRTHYQFYETTSEGTPLSPVFAALNELEAWLVAEQGYTETQAKSFCADGWAPTFVRVGGEFMDGIQAGPLLKSRDFGPSRNEEER